ncbi:MAG TPA: hypothetical protein VN711_01535 [Candidatus Saccharimonadales bacterium]|nr:hypothetical protein [Candidatus Saccharimonadales bacterium]
MTTPEGQLPQMGGKKPKAIPGLVHFVPAESETRGSDDRMHQPIPFRSLKDTTPDDYSDEGGGRRGSLPSSWLKNLGDMDPHKSQPE